MQSSCRDLLTFQLEDVFCIISLLHQRLWLVHWEYSHKPEASVCRPPPTLSKTSGRWPRSSLSKTSGRDVERYRSRTRSKTLAGNWPARRMTDISPVRYEVKSIVKELIWQLKIWLRQGQTSYNKERSTTGQVPICWLEQIGFCQSQL